MGHPARMIELLCLLLAMLICALWTHKRLLLENLLLRQQLQVALRGQRRPRLRTWDKLFWLGVRRLHPDWRGHLFLVRPETVLRWHRQGWRLFWSWRSGCALGRPRVSPEVRVLIATMAGQNPTSGEPAPAIAFPAFGSLPLILRLLHDLADSQLVRDSRMARPQGQSSPRRTAVGIDPKPPPVLGPKS